MGEQLPTCSLATLQINLLKLFLRRSRTPLSNMHAYKHIFRYRPPTHLLALTILITTLLRLTNLHRIFTPTPPPAPPPLAPLLSHLSRAHAPPIRDWKRPYILTAHGTRFANESVQVVVFTAGVLLYQFDRKFKAVACVIGDDMFPADSAAQEKVTCTIPKGVKLSGTVSVMLRYDDLLQEAHQNEQVLYNHKFRIHRGDLLRVKQKIPQDIKDRLHGDDAKLVASDLEWRESFVDDELRNGMARYELCMLTAMKQYPYLLKDWIEYYKRLGVDQFYIYDNHAERDLSFLKSEFVQTVYWPFARSQTQIFTHFLVAGRRRCKYVAFMDADEYLLVGGKGPHLFKDYVRHRMSEGYTQVIMPFFRMSNHGYVRKPDGHLPELYTRTAERQRMEKGKAVVDVDAGWEFHRGHAAVGGRDVRYFNQTIELNPQRVEDNALLIHYSERSWEEYVMKHRVGSASILARDRVIHHEYKVDQPMPWYMEESALGDIWTGMREFYQKVMKGERGESVIVWEDKEVCRTGICAGCWRSRPVVCGSA